jgi:demethylspheroidene O-methyltransferase
MRLPVKAERVRDRILSNPKFQRWAAKFPLTKSVADRRASDLFDLCAGFVYSQIFHACVRLRILEAVAEETKSAAELAEQSGMGPDAMGRLLDGAVALSLLERRGDKYGLGRHGTSYIGNPGIADMVAHHAMFYRDLSDPVALLRGQAPATELQRFWSYTQEDEIADTDAVLGYSRLMASSLSMLAEDILEAYPMRGHRHLLDVGGGLGAFVRAVADQEPDLALTLFDLPAVASNARMELEASGHLSRIAVIGGDAMHDPLPGGVDLVSFVRILHDHDDEPALAFLEAARRALVPGGTVMIAEPMRAPGAETVADAYFGFYLLAMGQGRPRSPEEIGNLLKLAGFERIAEKKTRRPMLTSLVVAEKPSSS